MTLVPPTRPREPIFNMPGLVVGAILVLVAIHAARALLSGLSDLGLVLDLGFVPARWSLWFGTASAEDVLGAATSETGENGLDAALASLLAENDGLAPWTALTYALLHGSWMHLILNSIWLAAFATPVVRRCGTARSLVLAVVTALGGALAHWLAHPLGVQPMIGASAIVSGLMAADAVFVFEPRGRERQLAGRGLDRVLSGVLRIAGNRTALLFLGSWFLINLLFGLLARPLGITDSGIAWEAHVGGLVAGLLVFPLLDPSGRDLEYPAR